MLKKMTLSLILLYNFNALSMDVPTQLGSDFNSYVGAVICSGFANLKTGIQAKDVEIKQLREDLNETKRLLAELRAQAQPQLNQQVLNK
jgi:hypothetical protein